jgi:hypothetical protein
MVENAANTAYSKYSKKRREAVESRADSGLVIYRLTLRIRYLSTFPRSTEKES